MGNVRQRQLSSTSEAQLPNQVDCSVRAESRRRISCSATYPGGFAFPALARPRDWVASWVQSGSLVAAQSALRVPAENRTELPIMSARTSKL